MTLQQGSDAWRQARCGSVGASDAAKVVRKIQSGGFSADRKSLMADKVLERLTGVPVEIPKTFAMQQGTAREPMGRLTYSIVRGVEVEEVGLVPHRRIKGSHASPDGFVGEQGLIEIKCPLPAQHLDTLLNQTISNDHIVQMMWQLACTGREWCDFVSFNSDFPTGMHFWVKRVPRDDALIRELEREIAAFIKEMEAKLDRLRRSYAETA
jgi:predicted phage-related endonuclease